MKETDLDIAMQDFVDQQEMAGGALFVRQGKEIVYRKKWGNVEFDSIYRMMSMTKCVTAVAVMICVERGWLDLDEPLKTYLPVFHDMRVSEDERYAFSPEKMKKLPILLLGFRMDKVKSRPAERDITIRDLLSHSSGLQQGLVGLCDMLKDRRQYGSLKEYAEQFAAHVLDFEPGTGTGYSPLAGFDILGYLVSVVSGMTLEAFVQKEICIPLEMKDTTFFLSEEQKKRLADVYKKKKGKLVKVTGTKEDMAGFFHQKEILFEHGCGGIYSTLDDYANFGEMLLAEGSYKGKQILKRTTVEKMRQEASRIHLEPEPGYVWGLGMKIRQDPQKAKSAATEGTYGWSGAFGTHFFISPKDSLEVVFMMNRSDIGGSGSFISQKVESMVFDIWRKGEEEADEKAR